MAIKTKVLIATILVSLFVHSNANAGFKFRKSTPSTPPKSIGSSRVDDVEREIIDAIISKKPATTIKKNEKLYIKTKADKEREAKEQKLVTGFGQDLPLVISLQQIVPSKYQFTLSKGIDPNLLTSWEGGKEWEKVLGDMLKKHDMSFEVKDTVVKVKALKLKAKKAPSKKVAVSKDEKLSEKPIAKKASKKKRRAPKRIAKAKPNTKLINKERQPKVKVQAPAEPKIKLRDPSLPVGNNAMTPVNIISSKNTPIKVDEDVKPFFDDNMLVDPNDPLAKASWVGHQHQTLKEVLQEWCNKQGVELYWTIDYDYKINKNIAFMDEFEVAVAKLIDIFRGVRPQPYGQLHQGNKGPLVLVVNSYDLSH